MLKLLHNTTEADLVLKVKEGDVKAYEELYYRYADRLLSFAQVYVKDQFKAEEVVQEIFIKIWEKRHLLDCSQSIKGYLYTAVKNQILNLLRHKVQEIGLEELQQENYSRFSYAENMTEKLMHFSDLERVTQQSVNEMPEVQKNIFRLSRFEHLNNEEISQKLNISKRTVEHQIYLALKTLKKVLVPLK